VHARQAAATQRVGASGAGSDLRLLIANKQGASVQIRPSASVPTMCERRGEKQGATQRRQRGESVCERGSGEGKNA
jgi:hypothetical protein